MPALAAGVAFAWVAGGGWAIPLLALLHATDAWRARRRSVPAPWERPHPGAIAAWILAALSVALGAGYRPDWLIAAGLGAATLARVVLK